MIEIQKDLIKISVVCLAVITISTFYISSFKYLIVPMKLEKNTQPVIFIEGYLRSGTTLMRVLLDVHPMIRCGPETKIIPRVLNKYKRFDTESIGLSNDVKDRAVKAFINTFILEAGKPAPVLCSKDPSLSAHIKYLAQLFPQAKFINMIRDGRAVVASLMARKISSNGTILSPEKNFQNWENKTRAYVKICNSLGDKICLNVFYEQLVLRSNKTMHAILDFLNIPWDPIVLHHEKMIFKTSNLTTAEPSTSQVMYAINLASLTLWASNRSKLSKTFIHTIHKKSLLLQELGYAKLGIPPNYGEAEPEVIKMTSRLQENGTFRKYVVDPLQ